MAKQMMTHIKHGVAFLYGAIYASMWALIICGFNAPEVKSGAVQVSPAIVFPIVLAAIGTIGIVAAIISFLVEYWDI